MADQPPRRSEVDYEQLGAQNVVIEQGEYRRWVRDQVGRSISGQLALLVSILGSGGFLAIAAGAFTYVNYQRDLMGRELEDELRATLDVAVQREVGYQVARAITDATDFAGDLANAVSSDPVLRQRFFEELFTEESVGALTGVAAGQRAVDSGARLPIRRFALSQVAVFGPELLPGVAAELLLSNGTPRELYEQALEYYDTVGQVDIEVGGSDGARAENRLFLDLPAVQRILEQRGASWTTVHEEVVGRVLDRLLNAGGDENCTRSPAYCTFFSELASAEADAAYARFAAHLRGEGADEPWGAVIEPLAAVDGTRGLLGRAPELYAAALEGDRVAELDEALQRAIARFEFSQPQGVLTGSSTSFAQAEALEALETALGAGAADVREPLARLMAQRMAGALDLARLDAGEEAAPTPTPIDAFVPRALTELERSVHSLERAAAGAGASNQIRAAALQTLKLLLAVAPDASAEYRLTLEMARLEGPSGGEPLAPPTRALLEDVRAQAASVFTWRSEGDAFRASAAALAPNGAAADAGRWLRIDMTAPGLAGELPIVIDASAQLAGYILVGNDGVVADGAIAPAFANGRTQILIDRADVKSDQAFIRLEPLDAARPVNVSSPQPPPLASSGPDREDASGRAALELETVYRLAPEAVSGTQAWLRFTAPSDGFYRAGFLGAAGGAAGRSLRVAVFPSGQDESVADRTLTGGFAEPLDAWFASAGDSYDILLEGQSVAAPIALRVGQGAGVRLNVGESHRLSLTGTGPVLAGTPVLPVGVYRIQTFQLGPGVDTVLELANAVRQVLGSDDDGGEESLASALTFTVRSETSFIASIRGYGEGTRGDFSVKLERIGDWTGPAMSLGVGQDQRLSFATTNPVELGLPSLPSGEYRIYTHTLDPDVDTVLELFSAEGESLGVDDDGGPEPLASGLTFRADGESFYASIRSYGGEGGGEFSVQLDRVGD
jgi:hypothetical protein